jgi:hypothetical protein
MTIHIIEFDGLVVVELDVEVEEINLDDFIIIEAP